MDQKLHYLHSSETSSFNWIQGRKHSTTTHKQSGISLYVLTHIHTLHSLQMSRWSGSKSKDTLCYTTVRWYHESGSNKKQPFPSVGKSRKGFQTHKTGAETQRAGLIMRKESATESQDQKTCIPSPLLKVLLQAALQLLQDACFTDVASYPRQTK